MALPRRAALGALLATAACGGRQDPPPAPARPPSYAHLTPLRLAVARIEIIPPTDPAATRTMPPAPLAPAEVVRIMAEDRLSAAGGPGHARFLTRAATLTRETTAAGGVFTSGSERITCIMRCRLEVLTEEGGPAGFAEAEVRRTAVRPMGSPAERARAAEEVVRQAGDELNVEFEFQLRRNLRALILPPPGAAPAGTPGEGTPAPVIEPAG
ncbi:hypothetical protein GXW77_06080 [Roseomonas alkaliterrae]|uniref:hypothetical protein n=1 Tax=Neoroseomonas alkaliterrae TaxID=1452450 RepID=UPI001BAAD526|nr:hypothetical protein [Neoroseomonas alkaliterrae]MBR0675743.1 hypothetical protein [Neoroseomonas alkaliterrae]